MQIPFRPVRRNQSAMALVIVLIFLALSLVVLGSMMFWTSSNTNVTIRNNQFMSSEYAAEAATEAVMAQMEHDFLCQSLTNATFYAALSIPQTNWPVTYVFSDTNGNANQISVSIGSVPPLTQPLDSQFKGLYGFPQPVTIIATATPAGQPYNVPATVSQNVQFAAIPVFQFAIFYNINLEMDAGAAMIVSGPVFSNEGLWAGTVNLTFNSRVTAVGQANVTGTDPFCTDKTDGGCPSSSFQMAGQPTSGNDALTLPIGIGGTTTTTSATNAEGILNLTPPAYATGTDAAYSTNGQVYNFNACDLIISNAWSGTNGFVGTPFTITYQDMFNTVYLNKLTNNEVCTYSNRSLKTLTTVSSNSPPLPATNYVLVGSSFPFVTNVVFWDYREQKYVQAVQFDVHQFNAWLNDSSHEGFKWNAVCVAHKTHAIDSVCIYNSVPLTNRSSTVNNVLPAVRIHNGYQLYGSKGLTISTPQPLYIWGDLNTTRDNVNFSQALGNTTYTYPCAVMADSVTILSDNWNDPNYTPNYALSLRAATATYINAAALEGIVQSTNSNYSGGVENFLRLEEVWSSIPLVYNGSIVVLFPSIYATNYWITPGTYYNAPIRNWGFDLNFNTQAGLPPLTPQSKAVIRGQWTGY